MLIIRNIINTKHLFQKMATSALFFGIIIFLMISFSDESFSLIEKGRISFIIAAIIFIFFYFPCLFLLKKVENLIFKPDIGEKIIKEAIVLQRNMEKQANYGKLWRTSERIVFKSIKNDYVEISLTEILEEKYSKNFYAKGLKIKTLHRKNYYFEIFS